MKTNKRSLYVCIQAKKKRLRSLVLEKKGKDKKGENKKKKREKRRERREKNK